MTVLRGPRLTLRRFRAEEFEIYWASTERWLDAADPDSDRQAARERLHERVGVSGDWTPNGIEFAIEHQGRLIGDIQARTNPMAMPPGVLEIGIELFDEADRGLGLGSEAIELFTTHLFDTREAHRVQLTTDLDNVAMRAAAERLGFGYEGVMRSFMPSPKGPRDYALYAMTRDDYREARGRWTLTS
jgi:RimJ/RimL family protein N-acetyltransferase